MSQTDFAKRAKKPCGCDDAYGKEEGDDFAALATTPDEGAGAAFDLDPDPRGTRVRTFKDQLIAPYAKPTGDKRRFAAGSLSVGQLPIGVKWQREDNQGHSTSVAVGRIDRARFGDGPDGPGVYASGVFFDPDPDKTPRWAEDCEEAYQLTLKQVIGPSVDLDAMEFHEFVDDGEQYSAEARPEIEVDSGRIRAVTLVQIPAFIEARPFALGEQDALEYAAELDEVASLTASGVPDVVQMEVAKAHEWDPLAWLGSGAYLFRGAALYQDGERTLFPVADLVDGRMQLVPAAVADAISVLAFKSGQVNLPEGVKQAMRERLTEMASTCELPAPPWLEQSALTAAGGFRDWKPDAAMFEDPKLDKPTPVRIENGRIFGHLADWRSCHIGFSHCVRAPRSRSNYAHFHVGEIETTGGPLAVGKVTIGGGHASTAPGVTLQAAVEHYDDAATSVAVVRAGQDKHGIWISGVAIPGQEDGFASLPLYPLSGDWRTVGGHPEMIAAMAVNVPGFSIPRVTEERGRVTALVAAGMLDEYRAIGQKARAAAADKGHANPDGSYPIETVADLQNAIQAYGRAKNKDATRRLIMRRAKQLKREDLIPESWRGSHANDYATDEELLEQVREEWRLDDALGAFSSDFENKHKRGFHGLFIKKLLGHHDGDGKDAGAPHGMSDHPLHHREEYEPMGSRGGKAFEGRSNTELHHMARGGNAPAQQELVRRGAPYPSNAEVKAGRDAKLAGGQRSHDIPGMSQGQRMNAYADVKDRFNLKHGQRDKLDASPGYAAILKAAHGGNWDQVGKLLKQHGIIEYTPQEHHQRRGAAMDSDYAAILADGLDDLGGLHAQQAALSASTAF